MIPIPRITAFPRLACVAGEGRKFKDARAGGEKRRGSVVHHLPQISRNSAWDVNGKRFFGSSHWKIPWTNGNSKKVVPFSRLGRSEWKFVYHLQVS